MPHAVFQTHPRLTANRPKPWSFCAVSMKRAAFTYDPRSSVSTRGRSQGEHSQLRFSLCVGCGHYGRFMLHAGKDTVQAE